MTTEIEQPTNTTADNAGPGRYSPGEIEKKWQATWAETGQNHADDNDPRPKFYNLVMFPYPSGDLHIGHWYNFTGVDVYGRYQRMNGYNVMQPAGFRCFWSARRERRDQAGRPGP